MRWTAIYYIGVGNQGRMYYENASSRMEDHHRRDQHIGASFIEQKAVEGFTVKNDIVFAQPGVRKLKYDVFSPNGAKNLPCIIIIHGGGWSVNNEDVMRGLAANWCAAATTLSSAPITAGSAPVTATRRPSPWPTSSKTSMAPSCTSRNMPPNMAPIPRDWP